MTTLKNALIDLASLNPSADGTTGTPAQVTAEDIANSQSEGLRIWNIEGSGKYTSL